MAWPRRTDRGQRLSVAQAAFLDRCGSQAIVAAQGACDSDHCALELAHRTRRMINSLVNKGLSLPWRCVVL